MLKADEDGFIDIRNIEWFADEIFAAGDKAMIHQFLYGSLIIMEKKVRLLLCSLMLNYIEIL